MKYTLYFLSSKESYTVPYTCIHYNKNLSNFRHQNYPFFLQAKKIVICFLKYPALETLCMKYCLQIEKKKVSNIGSLNCPQIEKKKVSDIGSLN